MNVLWETLVAVQEKSSESLGWSNVSFKILTNFKSKNLVPKPPGLCQDELCFHGNGATEKKGLIITSAKEVVVFIFVLNIKEKN